LGLKVVAEGVENSDAWDQLLALGCDTAQGYYMSRPLPAQEMTRWFRESPWAKGNSTVKMNLRGDLQSSKAW
jgi:EAL domain-containing protein (putative c-di-GMP-specific phosphodiesterase class I)